MSDQRFALYARLTLYGFIISTGLSCLQEPRFVIVDCTFGIKEHLHGYGSVKMRLRGSVVQGWKRNPIAAKELVDSSRLYLWYKYSLEDSSSFENSWLQPDYGRRYSVFARDIEFVGNEAVVTFAEEEFVTLDNDYFNKVVCSPDSELGVYYYRAAGDSIKASVVDICED